MPKFDGGIDDPIAEVRVFNQEVLVLSSVELGFENEVFYGPSSADVAVDAGEFVEWIEHGFNQGLAS